METTPEVTPAASTQPVVTNTATTDSSSTPATTADATVERTPDENGDATRSGATQEAKPAPEATPAASTDTTANDAVQLDSDLEDWAKSRGIEVTTDNEKKLAQMARDNQRDFHKKRQEKSQVEEAVNDLYTVDSNEFDDPDEAWKNTFLSKQNQLESQLRTRDFFDGNPDARNYEGKMAEIVKDELEKYGPDAARFISRDLDRLLLLAKASTSTADTADAIEKARKEERELLAKKQLAGAPSPRASTQTAPEEQDLAATIQAMTPQEWRRAVSAGWNPVQGGPPPSFSN